MSQQVLILIDNLKNGGAQTVALQQCLLGNQQGQNNYWLYSLRTESASQPISDPHILQSGHKHAWHPLVWLKLWKLIRQNKITVLQPHLMGSKIAAMVMKLLKPSLIIIPYEHGELLGGKLSYRVVMRLLAMCSTGFIACANTAAQKLAQYIYVNTPVKVVLNAIPSDVIELRKQKHTSKIVNVLFIGRLSTIKGINHLLTALALIKTEVPFKLTLVGDGPQKQDLQKLASKLNIDHLVEFVGFIPRPGLAKYLEPADIFVLPSLYEALPMVILEAIAVGIPVIASDLPGIRELLNENNSILVEPGSPHLLATALTKLLEDPEYAQKLARNATQLVPDLLPGNWITKVDLAIKSIAHA